MRQFFPVSGRVAALMASALLGGGLAAGCSRGEAPAPGGQAASSPQAAASPTGPAAAASPAAPAAGESPAGATAAASPGAGAGTQTAAAPSDGGGTERGQQLFAQNCATCHGASGHGDGPAAAALNPKPQDLTDNQWKYGGSPDQIFQTITNGVPGTAMVSWASLPEADRRAIVSYIQTLQGK